MKKLFVVVLLVTQTAFSQWIWQNPLPQGNDLRAVCFTDANNGTAVGLAGTIVRTTDGGVSWVTQTSGTTNLLCAVSFTEAKNGTAVGVGGAILRTTNGGLPTFVDERDRANANLPNIILIEQNYPNPFNPSTTFRFALPVSAKVQLEIVNVLGQHVVTLLNKELEAGYHETSWDTNLSSGIYFYRIVATSLADPSERFVETKRMLLLR